MPQAADDRSGHEIAHSHPLLDWYGRMAPRGVKAFGRDIVLPASMSSRFVVGVEPDGVVVLGIHVQDAPHLLSVRWASVSMLKNFKGGSWLTLVADPSSVPAERVEIRLFIPMASVVAARMSGCNFDRIRIRRMQMVNGKPAVAKGEPQAEVGLSMVGF